MIKVESSLLESIAEMMDWEEYVPQEMEYGLGVDVDPRALRLAKAKIESLKASVNFTVLRGSFGWVKSRLEHIHFCHASHAFLTVGN